MSYGYEPATGHVIEKRDYKTEAGPVIWSDILRRYFGGALVHIPSTSHGHVAALPL